MTHPGFPTTRLCALLLLFTAGGCARPTELLDIVPAASLSEFEQRVASIVTSSQVPGASAAIAKDGEIVWAKGFGLADRESQIAASATTRYHIASLTKAFAAVAALRLVEQGVLSLDGQVADNRLPSGDPVLVKHILSMTSDQKPGEAFRYDGNRFSLMDSVIARPSGRSFAQIMREDIAPSLGLEATAPGTDAQPVPLAQGYALRAEGNVRVNYPAHFSTAAGLVSSAPEVAMFWVRLRNSGLITPASFDRMITPAVNSRGDTLPYALGTFSQRYGGERVAWSYGYWIGNSSLAIHVPSTGITFVVLGNSEQFSAPYALGAGRLLDSPLAREFLAAFVMPGAPLR